jgi:lysophospholipase L1-like esterase
MAICLRLLLGWFLVSAALIAQAESPKVVRESIEWCNIWIPDADNAKLPRVLLIGDSITQNYYPLVAERLGGKASVGRLATSKSLGDPAYLAEVELVLKQYRFDVIHFNNGLHGFGYTEADYQRDFPALLAMFKKLAPGTKLIWATTTPMRVAGNPAAFDPKTERVKHRNRIAQEFVAKAGISVDDLFGLVESHPEYHGGDGVHFSPAGVAAEAQQVSRAVLEQLKGR